MTSSEKQRAAARFQRFQGEVSGEIERRRIAFRRAELERAPYDEDARRREEIWELLDNAGRGTELHENSSLPPEIGDSDAWAGMLLEAADAWRGFFLVAGTAPRVGVASGLEAGRKLFELALHGIDRADLAEQIDWSRGTLSKFGTEVPWTAERGPDESHYGLCRYFDLLAHSFSRWNGELPAGFDHDLTMRVGPNAPPRQRRPKIETYALDCESKTLTAEIAHAIPLQSVDRVRLLMTLADNHGQVSGPILAEQTGIAAIDAVVRGIRKMNGLETLIESDRQGYRLKPGTRICPVQPRPLRLR